MLDWGLIHVSQLAEDLLLYRQQLLRKLNRVLVHFKMRCNPPSRFSGVRDSFPAKVLSLILKVLDSYKVTAGCQLDASKSALVATLAIVCSSMVMKSQQER